MKLLKENAPEVITRKKVMRKAIEAVKVTSVMHFEWLHQKILKLA